jgi:hypothetical protein
MAWSRSSMARISPVVRPFCYRELIAGGAVAGTRAPCARPGLATASTKMRSIMPCLVAPGISVASTLREEPHISWAKFLIGSWQWTRLRPPSFLLLSVSPMGLATEIKDGAW